MSNILNYKQHSERGYRRALGKRLSSFLLLVPLLHILGDFWGDGWWWSLLLSSPCCQASLFLGHWLKGMGTECSFIYTEAIVCATGLLECLSAAHKTLLWNLPCRLSQTGNGRGPFLPRCLAKGCGISTCHTPLAMFFLFKAYWCGSHLAFRHRWVISRFTSTLLFSDFSLKCGINM